MKRRYKARRIALSGCAAGLLSLAVAGTALAGWQEQQDGSWGYQNEDGTWLNNGFSEDGYYLDASGSWRPAQQFLGTEVAAKSYFLSAGMNQDWNQSKPLIGRLNDVLEQQLGGVRKLELHGARLDYLRVREETRTVLFSVWVDEQTDGYIWKLAATLSRDSEAKESLAWCDYQVLCALMCEISRSGTLVSEAVYSSWEEGNAYGIILNQWTATGDCEIKFIPGDQAGYYYIRPIGAVN